MRGINGSVSYDTSLTGRQYGAFQAQFDYFNEKLFGGQLPPCLLVFSRKGRNTGGYFAPERWLDGQRKEHEIAINPDHWKRDPDHTISILVHEMAHHWQQVFGEPSRRGHHNKEWGAKMKEIGLHPSNTGQPGGKETGQQMSHYVIAGGPFERALAAMPPELRIPLAAVEIPVIALTRKQKTAYVCPTCNAKVWGKENLNLMCADCTTNFEEQD